MRPPRLRRLSPSNSFAGAALFLLAGGANAADIQPEHLRNFAQVNEHIWRGASPSDLALTELKALGINVILDLRAEGEGREHEKALVEQLGMRYEHIPLASLRAPSAADIEHALSLLVYDQSSKIFVHCMRGKDRTGMVIACYRIQHDGWDNLRALAEAKSYGMSSLEIAMQSYIRHFAPLKLP